MNSEMNSIDFSDIVYQATGKKISAGSTVWAAMLHPVSGGCIFRAEQFTVRSLCIEAIESINENGERFQDVSIVAYLDEDLFPYQESIENIFDKKEDAENKVRVLNGGADFESTHSGAE